MRYQSRGAVKTLNRSFANLSYDRNIPPPHTKKKMITARKITQQTGLAEEKDTSGSPGREKRAEIIKPKYFLLSEPHLSRQRCNPAASKILFEPVWTFLVFRRDELISDQISVCFYQSKAEAVTHHRGRDTLKTGKGGSRLLSAPRCSQRRRSERRRRSRPGEKESQRRRSLPGEKESQRRRLERRRRSGPGEKQSCCEWTFQVGFRKSGSA